MTVTALWSEYNLTTAYASPTTADITNTNWGSADSSNLTAASSPITNNTFSFYKRHAVRFTISASEHVSDFRFYASSGLSSAGVVTGTSTDTYKFLDLTNKTNTDAPDASTISGIDVPATSVPGSSNLGPATDITLSGDGTNLFKHQIFVHSTSTAGKSITIAMRYTVVA